MGVELTVAQMVALLYWLRVLLMVQTALGSVLCLVGIRIAWQDLTWAKVGNGGKQIASAMRLKVEVLLFLVFVMTLTLSVFYTVPMDKMIEASVLLGPVAKARAIFNGHMFLLLLSKVVTHRGRRQLDQYYDDIAAADVLRHRGVHSHKRNTDHESDTSGATR